jgi:hypothetical protein
VGVLGGLLKLKPEEYVDWQPYLSRVHKSAYWTIPALAIIASIAQILKSKIGSAITWRTIQYLLNQYKEAIFEGRDTIKDDPEHYHRITLYKHVSWRWAFCRSPWTGWMVPVARSGHTTHSWRIPRFRAPADDPDSAEGVAGQTWAQKRAVPVHNLPEITGMSLFRDIESYARNGFVSIAFIENRRGKNNARSLLGIPIEVKNQVWGALVIDSRSPEEISSKKAWKAQPFKTLTGTLSKLLES